MLKKLWDKIKQKIIKSHDDEELKQWERLEFRNQNGASQNGEAP